MATYRHLEGHLYWQLRLLLPVPRESTAPWSLTHFTLLSSHGLNRDCQGQLCLHMQPRWPYCRSEVVERAPPFFAVNEPLPIVSTPPHAILICGQLRHVTQFESALQLLAIIMGFQVPSNLFVHVSCQHESERLVDKRCY